MDEVNENRKIVEESSLIKRKKLVTKGEREKLIGEAPERGSDLDTLASLFEYSSQKKAP